MKSKEAGVSLMDRGREHGQSKRKGKGKADRIVRIKDKGPRSPETRKERKSF